MHIDKKVILGSSLIISALIIGIIFLASARGFSGQGKYVEVKGLSERIVKADRALWYISFEAKSNDSTDLYRQIESGINTITQFMNNAGFVGSEISVAPIQTYQDSYQGSLYRYNARVALTVYTEKVDEVRVVSQNTLELLEKGIIIGDSYVNFEFSDLNSIKPEMLAEAIAQARLAAEEFAKDSDARIGALARAQQGVFDISDKDPGSPEYKKVRVVSTLRYLID
ncbi:MAG: SIMPL domain-containing protein [Candidatus Pacebacteria bacterium]|nr:SIMPL domain-containing protein [Candidatus Paceibacterota bacterium]MCD8507851.1 SIMPL domain-containing protein [Candidatus Paceibacterota bacterium]MCD8527825.1 SIMPL domain-containing protein [Candidatus Paceibacterota bacterium]MCD8563530.1 SIMPL domain-containing protein [Candidatus Paceibacterota bacterium]